LPAKIVLASYIVRVYRFQKNNPRTLLGVVEEVGRKGKKAFTNYDELWEILSSPKGIKPSFYAFRGRRGLPLAAPGARVGGRGFKGERSSARKGGEEEIMDQNV